MHSRTLQEWADFTGMFAVMDAQGRGWLYDEEPKLIIELADGQEKSYWDRSTLHEPFPIPYPFIDHEGYRTRLIKKASNTNLYYEGWHDCIASPKKDKD